MSSSGFECGVFDGLAAVADAALAASSQDAKKMHHESTDKSKIDVVENTVNTGQRIRIPPPPTRTSDVTGAVLESNSSTNEADVSNSNTTGGEDEEDYYEDDEEDYDNQNRRSHHVAAFQRGRLKKRQTDNQPSCKGFPVVGNSSQKQNVKLDRPHSSSGSGTEETFSSLSGDELKPSRSKSTTKMIIKRKQQELKKKLQDSYWDETKKKPKLSNDVEDHLMTNKMKNKNKALAARIVGTGSIADTSKNGSDSGSVNVSSSSVGGSGLRNCSKKGVAGEKETKNLDKTSATFSPLESINLDDKCNGTTTSGNKTSMPLSDTTTNQQNQQKYMFEGMSKAQSFLCTAEGQMAKNPGMSYEEAKEAAKREYNRRNAARARVRNKDMVKGLQRRVSELTKLTSELQRTNEILRSQLEILTSSGKACLDPGQSSGPNILPSRLHGAANQNGTLQGVSTSAALMNPSAGMTLPANAGNVIGATHTQNDPRLSDGKISVPEQPATVLGSGVTYPALSLLSPPKVGVSTTAAAIPAMSLQILQQQMQRQEQQQPVGHAFSALSAAAASSNKNTLPKAHSNINDCHNDTTSSMASTTNLFATMLQRSLAQQLAASAAAGTPSQVNTGHESQQSILLQNYHHQQQQQQQNQQQPLQQIFSSYPEMMLAQIQKIVADAQSGNVAATHAAPTTNTPNASAVFRYNQQSHSGWEQDRNSNGNHTMYNPSIPTQNHGQRSCVANSNMTQNIENANPFQMILEALAVNNASSIQHQQQSLTTIPNYFKNNVDNEIAVNSFIQGRNQTETTFPSTSTPVNSAVTSKETNSGGFDPHQSGPDISGNSKGESNKTKVSPAQPSINQGQQLSFTAFGGAAAASTSGGSTTGTAAPSAGSSNNLTIGPSFQHQNPLQNIFQNIAPETILAFLRGQTEQAKP